MEICGKSGLCEFITFCNSYGPPKIICPQENLFGGGGVGEGGGNIMGKSRQQRLIMNITCSRRECLQRRGGLPA